MRIYYLLILTTILFGCKQSVENIQQLNGYWEIEQVVFETGESKEYNLNQTIEHFVMDENLEGYRTKVRVLLDGTFEVIADGEIITVSKDGDQWVLNYKTDFSQWTELIETLDTNQLVLVNDDKKTYHYKRYNPEQKP